MPNAGSNPALSATFYPPSSAASLVVIFTTCARNSKTILLSLLFLLFLTFIYLHTLYSLGMHADILWPYLLRSLPGRGYTRTLSGTFLIFLDLICVLPVLSTKGERQN